MAKAVNGSESECSLDLSGSNLAWFGDRILHVHLDSASPWPIWFVLSMGHISIHGQGYIRLMGPLNSYGSESSPNHGVPDLFQLVILPLNS